ncbi:Rieske (2Fe-2S) protein [Kitasatospora sp. GP82]|uniref:Rieske (2Fe-2S) protein n=1 Tax=Kitasatospora sp. GP82 TaxID=3035089 RepID=UPI002474B60D|nr:Rieske (2Fe-2S) protein [Kitasatospora sp. GP82]MDH6125963.1 Rieske Fe-S protein [Kitasatospora sp. GP82]
MSEAIESPTAATPETSRRTLLCGASAVLAVGGAIAVSGCSSPSSTGESASSSTKQATQAAGPVDVGPAADVPVGGGTVYREKKIVVTQPTAGQYKAFSAVCTHAGCVVDKVADGQIKCPCHGSRFAIADGAVQDGPAPSPLPEYKVVEQSGSLQVTPS